MHRERIADDIYVFRSQKYAQVTAGAIMTRDGVILIDTLFYPDETEAMRDFLEGRLGQTVRYLINTHYHADHTMGTYLFPGAQVIGHALCRQLLDTRGRDGLAQTQSQNAEFEGIQIVLPDIVFAEGEITLNVGGKTVQLMHMPGHSPDLIGVYVVEDGVLFASDNAMPVPTVFDGDYDALIDSMRRILALKPDAVVQGHGEVVLRGEIQAVIDSDMDYLAAIKNQVHALVAAGRPISALETITIESCGKSRIPLNGLVTDLHYANLLRLYNDWSENGLAPE